MRKDPKHAGLWRHQHFGALAANAFRLGSRKLLPVCCHNSFGHDFCHENSSNPSLQLCEAKVLGRRDGQYRAYEAEGIGDSWTSTQDYPSTQHAVVQEIDFGPKVCLHPVRESHDEHCLHEDSRGEGLKEHEGSRGEGLKEHCLQEHEPCL